MSNQGLIYTVPVKKLGTEKAILVDQIPDGLVALIRRSHKKCFSHPDFATAAHDFSQQMHFLLPFLGRDTYSRFSRLSLTIQTKLKQEALAHFSRVIPLSELVRLNYLDCTSQCLVLAEALGDGWRVYNKYDFTGPVKKPTRHSVAARLHGDVMIIIDPVEGLQQPNSWFVEPTDRFNQRYYKPRFIDRKTAVKEGYKLN